MRHLLFAFSEIERNREMKRNLFQVMAEVMATPSSAHRIIDSRPTSNENEAELQCSIIFYKFNSIYFITFVFDKIIFYITI
jgi:hypothetical protein